ncbi:MAG TPA: tetratricopeptide repeat protein [Candidatus Cybelea sp.]|jgi:predicted ATPase/DNA-binding XRE family transcriptional regulator
MEDERPSSSSRFGTLLREYRLAAGLSQEALAERARMSTHGVSALERGYRRSPQRDTLALLAEALELGDAQLAALKSAAARRQVARRGGKASENGAAHRCATEPALPFAWTSFLGREAELEEIGRLVREQRLVTITGSGGVGKTQTALQLGKALAKESSGVVCFAPLAPVQDQSFVVMATAASLGARPGPGQSPLEALLANLKNRELLLILDNCEHVIGEAARVAKSVLAGCANVRILATSREPLRVAGEHTYRLPSLSHTASMVLFVERARAVNHRFVLDGETDASVSELCAHLDGIPLAIELAAARIRLLNVKAINERLGDRFRLLTGGERTALPRQQTMRAAIDWSYDLLSEPERKLFERLSVFAGGCALEAAFSLYATEEMTDNDVLEALSSLIDKSLVVADLKRGEPRYRLLESSREYGREKLALRGEEGIIARRHAQAYVAEAERSARVPEVLARRELDNLRAALRWALSEGNDVLLGQRLAACLPMGMLPSEGRQWVNAALESVDARTPTEVVAALKHRKANAAFVLREYKTVVSEYGEVLRLYRQVGNVRDAAVVQDIAGHALASLGRVAEAKALIEEALTTARKLNDARLIARTSRCLAHALAKGGDFAAARSYLLEVLPIYEKEFGKVDIAYTINDLGRCEFALGNTKLALEYAKKMLAITRDDVADPTSMAAALNSMAVYLIAVGCYDEAEGHAREALELSSRHHLDAFAAYALQHLAALVVLRSPSDGEGHRARERAARVFGFVDARLASIGSVQLMTQEQEYDRVITLLGEAMAPGDLSELMTAGAAMSQEPAVAEALPS